MPQTYEIKRNTHHALRSCHLPVPVVQVPSKMVKSITRQSFMLFFGTTEQDILMLMSWYQQLIIVVKINDINSECATVHPSIQHKAPQYLQDYCQPLKLPFANIFNLSFISSY